MRIGSRSSSIISDTEPDEFFGRGDELASLLEYAAKGKSPIIIAAPPLAGTSELLKQTFDELFRRHDGIVPIYFSVRREDGSAENAARRFFYDFLRQLAAYCLNDATLIKLFPTQSEISGYLSKDDFRAIGPLLDSEAAAPLHSLIAAPLRITSNQVVVLIDDMEQARHLAEGSKLTTALLDVFGSARSVFASAAKGSIALNARGSSVMDLARLIDENARQIVTHDAVRREVAISDPVRDLICLQCGNRPALMKAMVARAARSGHDLNSFKSAQRIYLDELTDGDLAHILTNTDVDCIATSDLRVLNEMDRLSQMTKAVVVGKMLTELVAQAPKRMAEHYKNDTAVGIEDILEKFDGRAVPRMLLDYRDFAEHKSAPDSELLIAASETSDMFELPSIIHTTTLASAYPRFDGLLESRRAAVGFGFTNSHHRSDDQVGWLAAEVPSKLEANAETAEFWCDRLEAAALACGFEDYRIWLASPEGFEPEALDVLAARNAVGSSKKQVELLADFLGRESPVARATVYEIVLPMSDQAEMIAAKTLEEIGVRHALPAKALNQIKTALIEACINAIEHSHSPDRQIKLTFEVGRDTFTIRIFNRGVRLADQEQPSGSSTRRGWGLKLMRQLMDEVHLDQPDDGTLLRLVKYLGSESGRSGPE
ncbi:MAG: ATP-binding protein [Blastocatellia bacterium]|nr:ATP-binding protein [Blastocatellia bacterium]